MFKKISLTFSILLIGLNIVSANLAPVAGTFAKLEFFEAGWELEITRFRPYEYEFSSADSVFIKSGNDSAKIKTDVLSVLKSGNSKTIKVSKDDLEADIEFNLEKGRIGISFFFENAAYHDYLEWGEMPERCIRELKAGEHIISYASYSNCNYAVCRDTVCTFIIQGEFNGTSTSIPEGTEFQFGSGGSIIVGGDGTYTGFAYSGRLVTVSEIYILSRNNFGDTEYKVYKVEDLSLSYNPGDTVLININLKEDFVSVPETQAEPQALFFAYPSPADGFVNFSYKLNGTAQEAVMSIFCANGNLVAQLPINSPEGKIELLLGSEFPAGTYPYTVSSQGLIIYQGRFAVK
jgi:hypothetical protein